MEDFFEIESTSQTTVIVTCIDCNYSFQKTMQLPCQHIFAVHRKFDLSLSDPSLRWTLQYYESGNHVLCTPDVAIDGDIELPTEVNLVEPTTKLILSQQEKYRKAFHLARKLAIAWFLKHL